jgi:hypothetical protein
MMDNSKIKDMIENAYSQQRQMIEANYAFFKNVVENAYFQNRQMTETNALSIENFVRMYGNNGLNNYVENTKRDFLSSTEKSKEKLLSVLDQIRDDLLSNALKVKDSYVSGVDTFKSAGGTKDGYGKP